jgi:2-oxoglutarate ferredoxin oxidoreductase subunit alpha
LLAGGARASQPLKKMAKAISGSWVNMVALGLPVRLAGSRGGAGRGGAPSLESGDEPLAPQPRGGCGRLRRGGALDRARARAPLTMPAASGPGRWLLSGNEAAGFGALRGGVRFVAAYPITPATELLEWMAPRSPRSAARCCRPRTSWRRST